MNAFKKVAAPDFNQINGMCHLSAFWFAYVGWFPRVALAKGAFPGGRIFAMLHGIELNNVSPVEKVPSDAPQTG